MSLSPSTCPLGTSGTGPQPLGVVGFVVVVVVVVGGGESIKLTEKVVVAFDEKGLWKRNYLKHIDLKFANFHLYIGSRENLQV